MMAERVEQADVVVIGAGIAGASVAAELSPACRVILIEREAQPGYHTTGRSAALYSPTYGPASIRALTRASAGFFRNPPQDFAAAPLLHSRKVLTVAGDERAQALVASHRELNERADVELVTGAAARAMMPLLQPGHSAVAMVENDGADIDVHALHHGYLRQMRDHGGRLVTSAGVTALSRAGDMWRVEAAGQIWHAAVVVNAAGAWADEVAALAGADRVGLTPMRRTALIVDGPDGRVDNDWPMVVDVDEAFYLKPDAGRLLISPADETPCLPCDAQPEEIDVAICVDRIERAFTLEVGRVLNKWAGLRSFVADRTPVIGFAPEQPGFFWLAGQGGYGIQSAPAVARLAAALVLGRPVPDDIAAEGLQLAAVAPGRTELGVELIQ